MKKIKIVSMRLTNFKGAVNQEVAFTDKTVISGWNETGKSTLMNAFLWCLFGKDEQDRKDYEIKNTVRTELNRSEHEVRLKLDIDGVVTELRRVFKEKWTKRRGSEAEEFTGHETLFFVNDVPFSATEYQKYVSDIVSEEQFKLITNPRYFNTLSKEKKREMLMRLAGKITDEQIAGEDRELKGLLHLMMTSQKDINALSKEYAAKRKRMKDELADYPAKIEEVSRMANSIDEVELPENADEILQQYTDEVMNLIDQSKGFTDFQAQKTVKLDKLQSEISRIENEISAAYRQKQAENQTAIHNHKMRLAETESGIKVLERTISILQSSVDNAIESLNILRAKYGEEAQKAFDPGDSLVCPVCRQDWPDAGNRMVELKAEFNNRKAKELEKINKNGLETKAMIAETENAIKEKTSELDSLKAAHMVLMENQPGGDSLDTMTLNMMKEVSEATADLIRQYDEVASEQMVGFSDINEAVKAIEVKRDSLSDLISKAEQVHKEKGKLEKRAAELMQEMKSMGAELAAIEREIFVIEKFNRKHNDLLEERINKMFDIVKFRLFKPQINGGIEDVCDTIVNGVPYHAANNASQINAGIDICNVFAKRIGVSAPVWVDNAEAVNEVYQSNGQMVLLRVTNDKTLTIN